MVTKIRVGEAPTPFDSTKQLEDYVKRAEADPARQGLSYQMLKRELRLRATNSPKAALPARLAQ